MARDRKIHAREGEVPMSPPPSAMESGHGLAASREPPHPSLLELVRLIARQAALDDVAAQRAGQLPEE